MADFIPKREAAQYAWLKNLKDNLPNHVADIDITPARLAQVNAWIDAQLAAHVLARQKRAEWLGASSQKKLVSKTSLAGLRKEIARWKTADAGTTGMVAGLRLSASVPALDASTHQPELEAFVHANMVRLRIKKRGAAGVNIYMRLDGTAEWHLVGRATRSPYLDRTPVAVPGQAETREYRLISVVNDREIGQPSDVARLAVPGTVMM
jgi:hypothetical protein